MGDDDETGVAPTALARSIDGTEAQLAWSDADPPEVVDYRPPWIARAAVAAALVLIAGAGGVAVWQVREQPVTSPKVASNSPAPVGTTLLSPPAGTSAPTIPERREPVSATTTRPTPPPTDVETAAARVPVSEPVAPFFSPAGDAALVSNLRAYGWAVYDPGAAIAKGREVCTLLQSGLTMAQVKNRLEIEAMGDGATNPYLVADQMAYAALYAYQPCFTR